MRLLQPLVVISSGSLTAKALASPRTLPIHLRAAARGTLLQSRPEVAKLFGKSSKTFLNRFQAAMTVIYAFGPFRLDVAAGILFRGAEPVALGLRAVVLLQILLEGGGKPISKDRLIESAWPGVAVEDSNLTVQIAAVRRVFAEEPGGDRWLETLPRRGYRYVGPIAVKEQENQGAASNEQPALAPPDKPSLAVMPFTNMSGDPDQEYFADGIVEDIITGLSRIKWLFVIARNSSFIYKGQAVNVGPRGP